MKLTFTPPKDGRPHEYCINCLKESTVRRVRKDGKDYFLCDNCGQLNARSLYFDNRRYWIDDQGELWHETAAVFVRNPEGKFLFFDRTMFPFGLTVPAGHVDEGEGHRVSAVRELEEEVGIQSRDLRHVLDVDISGDKCSSGADIHAWHVYVEHYIGNNSIDVREEGKDPVWLSLGEAQHHEMPFAIRYLVDNHAADILAA